MDKVAPYQRRQQVLNLLATNGPMSLNGIKMCLRPEIERRRVYEVIQRLKINGLVKARSFPGLYQGNLFYQLSQTSQTNELISDLIGWTPNEVSQHFYRRVELLHSDSCAMWREYFRHLYPQAKVFREHEYYGKPELTKYLLSKGEDRDTNPDLLLVFPPVGTDKSIAIAVEIERNPKSVARIVRKLSKFATESRLDGLVYFCEGNEAHNRIKNIFASRVLNRAVRVGHYGINFAVFADAQFQGFEGNPEMFNAASEKIDLRTWMNLIVTTPESKRRNANFKHPASSAWKFESDEIAQG